ncbi:hypothetical protein M6B38_312995 [Iris pallida]|uniref:Uncharacterized protein n=1 Tax=Iris pallida TaxID=29817 RepID=A0AAX6HH07_IRIPA|nr:hypothetical protein M6B38_312995 [Iris pallida]
MILPLLDRTTDPWLSFWASKKNSLAAPYLSLASLKFSFFEWGKLKSWISFKSVELPNMIGRKAFDVPPLLPNAPNPETEQYLEPGRISDSCLPTDLWNCRLIDFLIRSADKHFMNKSVFVLHSYI